MPEKETEKLQEMFKPEEQEDNQFLPEKVEEKKIEIPEEDTEEFRNRRTRRLEAKYQAEREANIALNARLAAISEAQKFMKDTVGDAKDTVNEKLSRIYGTSTPEGAEATKLLQEAISEIRNSTKREAKEEALKELEERQKAREEETRKEEETLDSFVETIEDEYGVDLTSRTAEARKRKEAFFDELEKLSPKRNGEIVEYADPIAVWEIVDSKLSKSNSRSKELASRSMLRSSGTTGNEENNAMEQYLKDNGII